MDKHGLVRNWLFVVVAGFLFGVTLATFSLFGFSLAIFLLFLSSILFLYTYFYVRENLIRGTLFFVILFLVFSGLGVLRMSTSALPTDATLQNLINSKTEVTGTVVREPKTGETYEQYILKTDSGVLVLVRGSPFPKFAFADILSAYGKLELPKSFVTPQGTTFDYPAYLEKEGISYVMSFAGVKKMGEGNFPIQKTLFNIKNTFVSALGRIIPYPESGLLSGIILGVQDSMGKDLLNTFRLVGIIHIVVLSGYNITIVAESIRKSLSFLSRRKALFAGALGIIFFSTMVGWTPSVVRASVMALLAITARATRRTYDVSRALAVAAFAMVAWNPKVLIYDLGFQLSFLATIALIWISPHVIKKLSWLPERFGFRDIVGTTIAVQLFVLPLLVYSSGFVSLGGFAVNLLVLPIVPLIMTLGFVTGVLGLVSSALGFLPGAVTHFLLFYIIWISQLFSKLPGSVISVSNVSAYVPVIFYILFAILVVYIKGKRRADIVGAPL
jgi:competence protein ComEC